MLLADAAVIVEGQQAYVEPHDAAADHEALTALAAWGNQFSPTVATEPPDSLYFDLAGVTHLYGDEPALAAHVAEQFRAAGYRPRLAIADTPSAAWAAAHFAEASPAIIPARQYETLLELPVAALRLPDAVLEKLDRLGIHRVRQLTELPRKSLPSRLGQGVLDRLDCLTGDQVETIRGYQPPPTFEQQWLLDQPTEHWATVKHVVDVLLRRLASQLQRHGRGASHLAVCFDCWEAPPVRIDIGLYRPSADASHFEHLAQMQLESAQVSAAVHCVTVVADQTQSLRQRQHSLLAEDQADSRELAGLVERLSSRLGADHVVRALLIDQWQPEQAFEYQPLTSGRAGADSAGGTADSSVAEAFAWCPLRMFFPPQPIEVTAVIPGGPPARFHYQGPQRIAHYWGPQRLETSWWRGPSIRRDYYRVETETASRFWLFRRLDDGQWFLHGSFD